MGDLSSCYDYAPFVAEFYDLVYQGFEIDDIPFYIEYASRQEGTVLELGCGTGRVLIPLARAGYRIIGLDSSKPMLRTCEQKLAQEAKVIQEKVTLIQGSMTAFNTGDQYTLVTTPFRSFQHLISVEEQKDCLSCIYRHLFPSGQLILDVYNCYLPRLYDKKYMQEMEDVPSFQLSDGRTLRRTSRTSAFHRDLQYKDEELIYYVTDVEGNEERLVHSFPMRYFFRYELEHLLELCGFRVVKLYGDYKRSPYSNDSQEMIIVAEKIN